MSRRIKIILAILAVVICVLVVYNILCGWEEFFTISIGQVMTVVVATYFAFYFAQKNTDIRVQKEVYRKILQEIQEIVGDRNNYIISEDVDTRILMMTKRSLNNYTDMLKKYSDKLHVSTHVNKISEYVNEYVDFVGNHIDDIEYLRKSDAELRRPLDLINKEAIEIMMEMYK